MSLESIAPSVGGGAIVGFLSGYAIKKLAKLGMVIAGILTAFLGYLETQGLISVNWDGLSSFTNGLLGAGANAGTLAMDMVNGLIGLFPAAGGFALGATLGFKKA